MHNLYMVIYNYFISIYASSSVSISLIVLEWFLNLVMDKLLYIIHNNYSIYNAMQLYN